MIRNLLISTLLGLAFLLPVPVLAQKSVIAPEIETLVKTQSPETVKTSLRQDSGVRRIAQPNPTKIAQPDNTGRGDFRMLVVALLLMVAIAIRRYRSDAR
jgi:hypothetical protein